jgi:cob(I)alamin adenosyltransferase
MLLSVSTKTGDKGTSSLANGERVGKDSQIFDVIGNLDELNSWLGLVAVKMKTEFPSHREYILELQNTLFYIGAEVAQSSKATLSKKALTTLEKNAEAIQDLMKDGWHSKFVLPGGTELGGWLDIARTVCRRCERSMVQLDTERELNPILIKYLNRLSDYIYLLRCFVNHALEYPEQLFEVKK